MRIVFGRKFNAKLHTSNVTFEWLFTETSNIINGEDLYSPAVAFQQTKSFLVDRALVYYVFDNVSVSICSETKLLHLNLFSYQRALQSACCLDT